MKPDIAAILRYKTGVDERLTAYLTDKRSALARVNTRGTDIIGRLVPFLVSGKSIRGCLVAYSYTLFGQPPSETVYDVAAAMELFQAGFLIHDDIMDRDVTRRGNDSIHEQFRKEGVSLGVTDASHYGISMGINAADLCFFMAYDLLIGLKPGSMRNLSFEMQQVVIAQMQDVMSAMQSVRVTKEDVLSLYRYKTARYTFSLPLTLGAVLAGADTETTDSLDRFGESVGILFQIRDDELSVEGDSAVTGKPVGNDEREDKKTLQALLSGEELNELKSSLLEHAEQEAQSLSVPDERKQELIALIRFSVMRNR